MKPLTQMRIMRLERQVTLSQLSQCVGVDHTTLSRIERGLRSVDGEVADAIANELGTTSADLFVADRLLAATA
ncbi:MAG TPA: helix-turn-helix transcriptional regulator [Acidobacteriota bacterium]